MPHRPHYTIAQDDIQAVDCAFLLENALAEDAPGGDVTSDSIFEPEIAGQAQIIPREPGVLCGIRVVEHLLAMDQEKSGLSLHMKALKQDGDAFAAGDALLRLEGPVRTILRLERIILNFMQYLSGISSTVAATVAAAGPDVAILDTRKTLPGYRRLAKYAVYCGGGTNHRINLSDMAMIKDNHVAAAGGIKPAVEKIRNKHPNLPLEIEVDTLEQLEEALACAPRAVLLDNMGREKIDQALGIIRGVEESKRPFVELSGGWTPERLKELQGLGQLGVSMGFLTHTTRFLDLSMEIE